MTNPTRWKRYLAEAGLHGTRARSPPFRSRRALYLSSLYSSVNHHPVFSSHY